DESAQFFDAQATLQRLLIDDLPDAERFSELISDAFARATRDGRRIRIFGEMVALLMGQGNHRAALKLESLWNQQLARRPFTLFCAYPLSNFDRPGQAEIFNEVCGCHGRVIPAEGYSALSDPTRQLREIARLQQRSRRLDAEILRRQQAEISLAERERQ